MPVIGSPFFHADTPALPINNKKKRTIVLFFLIIAMIAIMCIQGLGIAEPTKLEKR